VTDLDRLLLAARDKTDFRVLADALDEAGRDAEARIARDGYPRVVVVTDAPLLAQALSRDPKVSVPAVPADAFVSLAHVASNMDHYYSERVRRTVKATRWYVNGIVVGRQGSEAGHVARRILRRRLVTVEGRLVRLPVFLTPPEAKHVRRGLYPK
jgi:hypothetical protein